MKRGSKTISIKMLKEVEMTVTKSRETRAVYICSKTGDEGSIYAAKQGMRACNNTNKHNPSLHLFYYGVTHVSTVACPARLSVRKSQRERGEVYCIGFLYNFLIPRKL